MKQYWMILLVLMLVACSGEIEGSDNEGETTATKTALTGSVKIESLIRQVETPEGKPVVIGAGVPASVAMGEWNGEALSYSHFLSVLWNNRLTAVEVGDLVSVIPAAEVRSYPLPVHDGEQLFPADQWVSRIIRLERVPANQLIPHVRPIVSREGHLTAIPEANTLLIVDRAANVERVVELLHRIDVED